MPTLNSTARNISGQFDSGDKIFVRNVEFTLDLATNAVMGTATDNINLATLPAGLQVVSVTLQQIGVGTGSGTLVGAIGATTVTGTLASTAPLGTLTTTIPAALPLVVPLGGTELNVLGATAVRLDGRIRVVLTFVETDRLPRQAIATGRDATL